jgi:hypothetical protein
VKKLLIIQKDDPYFLFETIQVIEKHSQSFKDFEVTLLANEASLKAIYNKTSPVLRGITSNTSQVLENSFDLSVNLSLSEETWDLQSAVKASSKLGIQRVDGQICVDDLWSSYLLTLKSRTPFLTFHLQDVYRNILGIKTILPARKPERFKQFAIGMCSLKLFSGSEQEKFIESLSVAFPQYPIRDLSEIDLVSDISQTLYIGPTSLEALKFCEAGGRGVFLSSQFQGFNLFPYSEKNYLLSSNGGQFKAEELVKFILAETVGKIPKDFSFNIYQNSHENTFGNHLYSLNESDDNYPFYQSHLVLWNYLLSFIDSTLEVTSCSHSQVSALKANSDVLTKLIRLHDYAMSSIDTIYKEAKSKETDNLKIKGHVKNLEEIEQVFDQIADSHPFLRPFIDFYRIRRGQNQGKTLKEQSESSLLTYTEEHQVLQALQELFSVTLKKNEVNI